MLIAEFCSIYLDLSSLRAEISVNCDSDTLTFPSFIPKIEKVICASCRISLMFWNSAFVLYILALKTTMLERRSKSLKNNRKLSKTQD